MNSSTIRPSLIGVFGIWMTWWLHVPHWIIPAVSAMRLVSEDGHVRAFNVGTNLTTFNLTPRAEYPIYKCYRIIMDEDLAWLNATFSPDRLMVFSRGGRLRNLSNPTVQRTIVEALAGLKPTPLRLNESPGSFSP